MLATLQQVQQIPGLGAQNAAWLGTLLASADAAVKSFCKQNLEPAALIDYYSGNEMQDLIIQQTPLWLGITTVAAASAGAVLPQTVVNVVSTAGFGPSGTFTVQLSPFAWASVAYTGTTSTSFTGCSGGVGTLALGGVVTSPVVWYDPAGLGGQLPGGFPDSAIMGLGTQYMVLTDTANGTISRRGLLRKVAGAGPGTWIGYFPENWYTGKLSATRLPCWPRGQRNIKVAYTAGWDPIPPDLTQACLGLVAWYVRCQPLGSALSSEGLGAYSYNVMSVALGGNPELGTVVQSLKPYRDIPLGDVA